MSSPDKEAYLESVLTVLWQMAKPIDLRKTLLNPFLIIDVCSECQCLSFLDHVILLHGRSSLLLPRRQALLSNWQDADDSRC